MRVRSGQWTRTCHTRHAHARSHCGRKAQLIISPGSACELIPRTHTPAPEGRRWGIANTELVGIAVQPRPPGAAVGDDCLVQLVTLRQGLRPGAQRRLTLTLTAARCSASTNPAPNPNPNPACGRAVDSGSHARISPAVWSPRCDCHGPLASGRLDLVRRAGVRHLERELNAAIATYLPQLGQRLEGLRTIGQHELTDLGRE